MRNASPHSLLFLLCLAQTVLTSPSIPFSAPIRQNINHNGLFKRTTTCQKGFLSCDYMNIEGYCCPSSAQCGIDGLGHVACCPIGAACSGTVQGGGFATQVITQTQAQVTPSPAVTASLVGGQTTGAGGALVLNGASTTTAAGVFSTNGGSASYVPNQYYPSFKVIPTTYVNAASCSAAWSGCQTDLVKCTSFLGGGVAGVTISAPNFQTLTPTVTYDMLTASAICSSLSQIACSGLQVTACTVFGNSNAAPSQGCGAVYAAGMGAAVGVAGQWMWA